MYNILIRNGITTKLFVESYQNTLYIILLRNGIVTEDIEGIYRILLYIILIRNGITILLLTIKNPLVFKIL